MHIEIIGGAAALVALVAFAFLRRPKSEPGVIAQRVDGDDIYEMRVPAGLPDDTHNHAEEHGNTITLRGYDGEDYVFRQVDQVDFDGKTYGIFLPGAASFDDADEYLVMRFNGSGFELIKNEGEFNRVVAYLNTLGEE